MENTKLEQCSGIGCTNTANSLKCPTCVKLNLKACFFCSQECFKKNWPIHKLVHVESTTPNNNNNQYVDDRFVGYEYRGKLRKGKLTPKREVPKTIKRPDHADHPQGVSLGEVKNRTNNNIRVYNKLEIEKMRKACELGREILDLAGKMVKVGVTTEEIDKVVHDACVERGVYPSPLNYYGFPKSCCTSINEIICHGIPDDTVLQDGDIVNVDVSIFYEGFHADLNETYLVGNVDEEGKHLVQSTFECLEKAIEICKPGVPYRNIGEAIQKHAAKNGLSVVRSYCGHGVGELFHGDPSIPHYGKNKAKGIMKAGHVFTIEPMINVGTWRDTTWPDKWTSSTEDGKRSAQFEHTLLITETGVEVLTKRKTGSYIDRF